MVRVKRIDSFQEVAPWLVFPLSGTQAVFQHRADVIKGLTTDPGYRLNAPFIKGLRAYAEARRHPALVEPVGLPSDV